MAFFIANQAGKRNRAISKLINYVNKNYEVPHEIKVHVINFPCVYVDNCNPVWGFFYAKKNDLSIEIANDFEWYEKNIGIKFLRNEMLYILLANLCHEIYHYFQFRDNKNLVENWVDKKADEILAGFIRKNKYDFKSILTHEEDKKLFAIDPVSYAWRGVK